MIKANVSTFLAQIQTCSQEGWMLLGLPLVFEPVCDVRGRGILKAQWWRESFLVTMWFFWCHDKS